MAITRQHYTSGLDAPAYYAYDVTPNDSTDLPSGDTRALYVGGSGNIVIVTAGSTEVTLLNVQAGAILPIRVSRVKATNTTATGIVALL
jgi:hypothetical protein